MIRFAIPALAIAATASQVQAAEVQIASQGPVVELSVSETVDAKPDIVDISAGVTSQARTAVEAMQINAREMTAVIDRIKALGIDEDDIQTTGINLGAQYDYDQSTRQQVFRGYQASNRVSVTLRDVKRAGEVLDALVAAGATDIGGPRFSLDDDSPARAQARPPTNIHPHAPAHLAHAQLSAELIHTHTHTHAHTLTRSHARPPTNLHTHLAHTQLSADSIHPQYL